MPPKARNSVWCDDFVFDSCANGQQLKCLTVVDECACECLVINVAGSGRRKPGSSGRCKGVGEVGAWTGR